jgi:hypothetical protein
VRCASRTEVSQEPGPLFTAEGNPITGYYASNFLWCLLLSFVIVCLEPSTLSFRLFDRHRLSSWDAQAHGTSSFSSPLSLPTEYPCRYSISIAAVPNSSVHLESINLLLRVYFLPLTGQESPTMLTHGAVQTPEAFLGSYGKIYIRKALA